MQNFTVYKHTSPNGKVYIGITEQNPAKRWQNGQGYKGNFHFYRAIQKYGWNNFNHEILYTGLTKEQACKIEVELIALYKSDDFDYGYNILFGGECGFIGFKHSKETRKKMSESHKGQKNYMYGKHHTDESRKKMSDSHIGRPAHNVKAVLCVERGYKFSSIQEAANCTGANRSHIADVCNGKRRTAGGYHWRFIKNNVKE